MKLIPLGRKIHVKLEEKYGDSQGGIIIPQTSRDEKARIGTVVAEGPDVLEEHGMSLVGERVLLSGYSGQLVSPDGKGASEVWSCDVDRVLAILEPGVEAKGGGDSANMRRCPKCGPARSELGKGSPFLILDPDPKVIQSKRRMICERCGHSEPA